MTNEEIIARVRETASLMELHEISDGYHYKQLALGLEKTHKEINAPLIEVMKGFTRIQPESASLVAEIAATGTLKRFEELVAITPQGVREMMALRGVGPRKARIIWRTLGIEDLTALLHACEDNRIAKLPAFGQIRQAPIRASLAFRATYAGQFHYATALPYARALEQQLSEAFPDLLVASTGPFRRKMETVDELTYLVGRDEPKTICLWLDQQTTLKSGASASEATWQGCFAENKLKLTVCFCPPQAFYKQLILETGAKEHLALPVGDKLLKDIIVKSTIDFPSEEAAYKEAGLPLIPPELREGKIALEWAKKGAPKLVEMKDLRGVLHNHTTDSDGEHSLEEMARHCKGLGYEYIGITDHNKNPAYMRGLTPTATIKQHAEIDRLNKELAPFKIFKGIECDIKPDGELHYGADMLSRFDFVIASVHTALDMKKNEATKRVLKAINNPHTTMLGHLTNRLLLNRNGFPLDHQAVLDACARKGVIIELNANPWRLELDWRWIDYALSKNVKISINPDAHDKEAMQRMYYGVCVGRKGGLTKEHTFNALSREEIEACFAQRKPSGK